MRSSTPPSDLPGGRAEPLLTLDRLTVGYGNRAVLTDVSLVLHRGSFTGLLGANGSGKSTLIKTMLGIIPPLAGQVMFNSTDGESAALGYVPQRETLDSIFLLSSFEVVLMAACARVKPGRYVNRNERDWALHCLAETDSATLARKRFSELSGGQRQRVLIARALARKPDFLLLDEPTAGTDAGATQTIMELLHRVHEQHRLTILMVNHDLAAVRKAVREVIWLHQGRVLHGTVTELLSREKIEEIMELELR